MSNPKKKLHTTIAIMQPRAKDLSSDLSNSRNQVIVNSRVGNPEDLVVHSKRKKIPVNPVLMGPDVEGIGKFTHLNDPEGNRIVL